VSYIDHMRGHAGAVLTGGLAAMAVALAALQALVIAHGAPRFEIAAAARPTGQSNRYSAPGGRSGVPYLPFDEKISPTPAREGRPAQQKEEHHSPPPSRFRSAPPRLGPHAPRKAAA
jgi:hypothetical protein